MNQHCAQMCTKVHNQRSHQTALKGALKYITNILTSLKTRFHLNVTLKEPNSGLQSLSSSADTLPRTCLTVYCACFLIVLQIKWGKNEFYWAWALLGLKVPHGVAFWVKIVAECVLGLCLKSLLWCLSNAFACFVSSVSFVFLCK